MRDRSVEATRYNFDPMSISGLPNKAREAVNAAFAAMSAWRNETAENSEKNTKKVIDKMAVAAAALGWPEQIVEVARVQMRSIAEMQIKTMDHMIDAWEEQLKSPDPTAVSPSAMLSKLQSLPNFGAAANWPSANTFQTATANPFGIWMQFAEQWQKAYTDAMTFWTKSAGRH